MNIATQLEKIMVAIWDESHDDRLPKTIVALASYVKTHNRVNHDNVWEVMNILFKENVRTIQQRKHDEHNPGDASHYIVDVQFDDESQCLIICAYGIGHGIEFVS